MQYRQAATATYNRRELATVIPSGDGDGSPEALSDIREVADMQVMAVEEEGPESHFLNCIP